MGDDNGGGKRGEGFEAVLLGGVGAGGYADGLGEEGARIAVVAGKVEAAGFFGVGGAEQGHEGGEEDGPVGEGHEVSFRVGVGWKTRLVFNFVEALLSGSLLFGLAANGLVLWRICRPAAGCPLLRGEGKKRLSV